MPFSKLGRTITTLEEWCEIAPPKSAGQWVDGRSAKEIARALGISTRTVEVHKTRLMAKLGARNVAELVRFALSDGTPSDTP